MKSDELIKKAEERISKDRQRLEDLYSKVKEVAEVSGDILGLAAVSEHLVKITDSLTKQTGQLVDLAKLKHKTEMESGATAGDGMGPDGEFSEEEAEELFNDIDSCN